VGGFGNRGFWRGASLDLDAKARRALSQIARAASNLVDNYLTLSSAERRRLHGHGQAQAPLLRESRELIINKVQESLRQAQEVIRLASARVCQDVLTELIAVRLSLILLNSRTLSLHGNS